jgi:hypothetical protein
MALKVNSFNQEKAKQGVAAIGAARLTLDTLRKFFLHFLKGLVGFGH